MAIVSTLLTVIPILLGLAIVILVAYSFANKKEMDIKLISEVVVAIIIVGAVLVPIINNITDESKNIDSIYYDDYIQSNLASSCSGSLELININGIDYIHAIDVGEGSIEYTDGTTKTITVEKAKLDVFMFIGQSNIAYWVGKKIDGVYYDHAIPSQAVPKSKLGTTYYYGNENTPLLDTMIEPESFVDLDIYDMNSTETGDAKIGSLDYPFASGWHNKTGNKCLIVNCAWSGTSINTYVPGGKVYNHAKLGWNDAISKIDTDKFDFKVIGYVFCQGEANGNTAVATYKSEFMQMHNALIGNDPENVFSEYTFDSCFIDMVRSVKSKNAVISQRELAQEVDSIYMCSEIANTFTIQNGLLMVDNLHYTQKGQNEIGKDLIKNIYSIYEG